MVGDLRKAMREVEDTQRRVLQVTATACSDDRMIRAVVGPRGHLVELEIDPRIYRKPNSAALAASILATVRDATEQVLERTQEILDEHVPSDMRVNRIGGFDVHRLLRTHDADLREADLPEAHLREADLREADLHESDLHRVDQTGAGPFGAGPHEEDRRD